MGGPGDRALLEGPPGDHGRLPGAGKSDVTLAKGFRALGSPRRQYGASSAPARRQDACGGGPPAAVGVTGTAVPDRAFSTVIVAERVGIAHGRLKEEHL